jgi:hypothetical protein
VTVTMLSNGTLSFQQAADISALVGQATAAITVSVHMLRGGLDGADSNRQRLQARIASLRAVIDQVEASLAQAEPMDWEPPAPNGHGNVIAFRRAAEGR